MASFTPAQRKALALRGVARPDGSFPIRNAADLQNALNDWNRMGQPADIGAWIRKRAKTLGLTKSLPPKLQPASYDQILAKHTKGT